MIFILKPQDDEKILLDKIQKFLAQRGLNISQKKTRLTATTEGFDFLGWHFKVQDNGKFRCTPSKENYQTFRKKVKSIINCSNYGAREKSKKLAPLVRGWRNYHRYCKMNNAQFSLWYIHHRAWKVFNQEKKLNRYEIDRLIKQAFPLVSYSENRFVNVKGNKSPYDGDLVYWSQRNSKIYESQTAKILKKQNHICGYCGLKFLSDEKVELHHIDGHHNNCRSNNLLAVHESCHDYIHMSKRESNPN